MKLKKRWKRLLLALVALPILVVGTLVIYLQGNQSAIIKAEIAKLNKEHQGLVNIGDSELSIFGDFPHISIKAYDVQVFESKADGAPLIMEVKDVYVGFNLWDIVRGDYDIQSIVVEEGVFNLVIHQNNTTNIQLALESSSETDSVTTNIHLKEIKFRNLDVHTLDEATRTDVEKFIYFGQGGFIQKDSIIAGHIDTELELNVIKDGDTTFIRKKHFEVHTDVSYNAHTGMLDIAPSGIVMENGDFELAGSIDVLNDVNLDLTIEGTKPNFDMLIAFAPSEVIPFLERYENAGDIYFSATVEGAANMGNRPLINAEFGAGKAFLENKSSETKIDQMGFTGHFTNGANRDASTMEFSITDIHASLEKGEFEGSLYVKNFDTPEVDMQMNSNFNLDFITDFFELDQVKNPTGTISVAMNFHDIIDIDHPEKALQQFNQAYYAALKVENLSLDVKQFAVPIDSLNVDLVMNGKQTTLNQFELKMGNSDFSVSGFLSDLPAIVHHTDTPVEAHLDILAKHLDLAELSGFNVQDSISQGIDEQIDDLSLGLSFIASARDFTESAYLPKGEFFIDSLHADLKHYPHKLHDFHADIFIDESDLKIVDFTGFIDDSDFHVDGLIHDFAFWMQPELNGDVDLDMNLISRRLRLEDIFSYKGENYVPEDYRHEIFDDLSLHFTSSMHYKDSTLHSIDMSLDKLDTKMEVHPLRFTNFRGDILYEDQHILIKDFHGEIGATNFNFDLNYYLGTNADVKKQDNYLFVYANYIDFDELFNFQQTTTKAVAKSARTTADIQEHAEAFNIYELPFTDMRFKANIDHFIYHRVDLQNIRTDFRITPNHYIYIDTLNMDAAGGNIQLSGYFNGSDPKHIYMQPKLVLNRVELDKLLFKFENFGQDYLVSDNLKGRLTSTISGKIRIYPDMVADLDQSEIHMKVEVLNGRLRNFDPMLALSDYMGDKNLTNIRFDTLQNNLAVRRGIISIPNMTIESSLGHMELSGTHDSKQNIDYSLRIPWKTVRKAAWQKIFGSRKDTLSDPMQEDDIVEVDPKRRTKFLNVQVSGNIQDYEISLGKKKS